jgi:hypothetical protein
MSLDWRVFDHFGIAVPKVAREDYPETLRRWCYATIRECEQLLEDQRGSAPLRFVVFGELSFPSFWGGTVANNLSGPIKTEIRRLQVHLDAELQRLSSRHGTIIVSGSFHDPDTFGNVLTVYFPFAKRTVIHRKLTVASAIGEDIRVPNKPEYPIYLLGNQNQFRFCVFICSDAFDLNLFFEQMCGSSNNPNAVPNLYLVPSFHVTRPGKANGMWRACQQLSLATGQTVVFVNQSSDERCAAVFVAGSEQKLEDQGHWRLFESEPGHVQTERAKSEGLRETLRNLFRKRTEDTPALPE